jgi:hypothetical protein
MSEPTLLLEIRKASATNIVFLRDAPGEIDGKAVLARTTGAKRIAVDIQRLVARSS